MESHEPHLQNPPSDPGGDAPDTDSEYDENSPLEEARMAVWEHLDELRKVLIRSLIAVGLGLVVTYNFSDYIMHFLEQPLLKILPPQDARLVFTGIADKFVVYFKVSVIASLFLVLPFVLYQLWSFIRPALYEKERKFAAPFVFFGTVAFFTGLAFAYYLVIPYGYKFLIEFGNENVLTSEKPMISITEYFDLTSKLMLAVGLIFETPVILVLLGRFGIVNAGMLKRFRRHAVVASALIAAIATPSPDAFTMIIVMVPLYLLYEISIVGVTMTGKR